MNAYLSGDTATQATGQFLFVTSPETGKPEKKDKKPLFKLYSSLSEAFEASKDKAFEQSEFLGDLITAGDFCIFFGASNTGKSFFSYQLAQAIAEGRNFFDVCNTYNFPDRENQYYKLKNVNQGQIVLYADFESSIEKLTRRYSNNSTREHYKFSNNIKVVIPEARSLKNKLLFVDDIEKRIIETGAKFLIIDNLSAITYKAEESTFASELMNRIKDLQDKHGLTVVVIAHTPKGKNGKPISMDDLQGSANFSNLADSVFSIGKTSTSENLRYIKQLKSRVNEIKFNNDKVVVIELKDLPDGFTGYDFSSYENEENIIQYVEKSTKERETEAITDYLKNPIMTAYAIAKALHSEYGHAISFDSYKRSVLNRIKRIKAEQDNQPQNNDNDDTQIL